DPRRLPLQRPAPRTALPHRVPHAELTHALLHLRGGPHHQILVGVVTRRAEAGPFHVGAALRSQLAAQSPHGPLVAVYFADDGASDSQTEHLRADISRRLQL